MSDYGTAIDDLIDNIRSLTPSYDPDLDFHCEEEDGIVVPLEEVVDPSPRLFDLRHVNGPVDDGQSGYVFQRFMVELELRILYPDTKDRARFVRMASDDVTRISNAIIRPSRWTTGAGIESITPPGQVVWSPFKSGQIATIGFTLYYTDSTVTEVSL